MTTFLSEKDEIKIVVVSCLFITFITTCTDMKQVNILSPNTPRDTDNASEDLIEINQNIGETLRFEGDGFEKLKILISKSRIADYARMNELQNSVTHHWSDVMNSLKIESEKPMNEWEIVKKLLNGESSLRVSDIMAPRANNAFQPMLNSIYQDISYEFYALFRDRAVKSNIPEFLNGLGLDRIYEQVVFYEYIYSSPVYALYHKIRWMIDYEYYELIELLSNHLFDIWDQRRDATDIMDYAMLSYEYLFAGHCEKVAKLAEMLELHSHVLAFNVDDFERHVCNDTDLNLRYEFGRCTNKSVFITDNQNRLRIMARKIGKTSRDIDCTPLIDIYRDYVCVDLLMRVLEFGDVGEISNDSKSNIIYMWLIYSSRILKNSNGRYTLLLKRNGESLISPYLMQAFSRRLRAENLYQHMQKVNIDFDSMLHIYLHDEVGMFRHITRNCEFQAIDPSIVAYYPTHIVNYISDKTGKSLKDVVQSVRANIEIDLHLLCRIDEDRLSNLSNIVFWNLFADEEFHSSGEEIKLNVSNLFSTRIDPMNEDLVSLHELRELEMSRISGYPTLSRVLNFLFYQHTSRPKAHTYFSRTSNLAILGVLSFLHISTEYPERDDGALLMNYISYLASLKDFNRVIPSISDLGESLQFMGSDSKYLIYLRRFISTMNEAIREEKDFMADRFLLDDEIDEPNYLRYGVFQEHDSESDTDTNTDSDFEDGTICDSESDSGSISSYLNSEDDVLQADR